MKIFNKRPIVVFAIVMVISVLVLLYHNSFALRVCMLSIGGALLLIFLILWIFIKNKTCKYIFSRIFIIALAVLVSLSSVVVSEKFYYRDYHEYNGYAVVSGRIAEVGDIYNNNKRRIILDGVNITADTFEKDLHYKASIVVICDGADPSKFVVGKNVIVSAKVSSAKLYYVGEYGLSFTYMNNKITWGGYATEQNFNVVDDNLDLTLSDRINQEVEDIVNGNLDKEYAGLALGLLFGDKSSLDDEIKYSFSATGISHLLAVSGLHVGFLLTILVFICKLCKIKGVAKFLLISSILIFYCYLCGFSVSVIRATIMAMCSLFASCRYKRYDSLNALSIACIILLIFMPFTIATIGFKLSFIAVLSIILLARPIAKLLGYIFKEKMANNIATMLAVQIGTTFLLITHFENITLVSIVANFVCIPLTSLAYMALFVSLAISLVFRFLSVSVYLFQFVMQVVVKFVHMLSSVKAITLNSWKGIALTYTTIPAMFVSSNYLFVNKTARIILCTIFWLASVIILFV